MVRAVKPIQAKDIFTPENFGRRFFVTYKRVNAYYKISFLNRRPVLEFYSKNRLTMYYEIYPDGEHSFWINQQIFESIYPIDPTTTEHIRLFFKAMGSPFIFKDYSNEMRDFKIGQL